jgi:hypothetical protein
MKIFEEEFFMYTKSKNTPIQSRREQNVFLLTWLPRAAAHKAWRFAEKDRHQRSNNIQPPTYNVSTNTDVSNLVATQLTGHGYNSPRQNVANHFVCRPALVGRQRMGKDSCLAAQRTETSNCWC